MSAALSIQVKGEQPQKVVIGVRFIIGRDTGNDWELDDSRVSRNHAMIHRQESGRYHLADLGSANGTFLNGQRISQPAKLKAGDVIQIANCRIRFLAVAEGSKSSGQFSSVGTLDDRRERTVSILVVDIRGYTRLSEVIPADELSDILSRWFNKASEIIQQRRGSIDKFIGDAVMAFWLQDPDHAADDHVLGPLEAAHEVVRLARSYGREICASYPELHFDVGCGVSTGRATVGNIGLDARRDFTVTGDCVNVAFRIESLCGDLKRSILLTEGIRDAAGDGFVFEDLGHHTCKGKADPVRVFALASSSENSDTH
jgi:adenylate cyclase